MKKGLIVFLLVCILLLVTFNSTSVDSESISSSPLIPPKSGLYYITPPIINWYKYGIYITSAELVKDWSNKPFMNTTLMYIGGVIGFRPFMNVTLRLYSYIPGNPGSVDVYSDGKFYDTIYSKWVGGPMCRRVYDLYYYEKGFHRLTFIPCDNSSRLDVDVQIGFNGFFTNIFPYLFILA